MTLVSKRSSFRHVFSRNLLLRTKNWTPAFAGVTALVFALLILLPDSSHASNKNAGTSGAQFLKIGAGARSTAMGDAFVGVADDVNAIYYNPAGLATLKNPELAAMHTQWFQGMNYDFGAFALPSDVGTFGISAATLKADDLEKRSADESFQGNFESLDSAYSLANAKEVRERLSVGVTARYLREKIDTASAGAWSGDIGVVKDFESRPFRLGLAIRHFGQGVKFNDESDPQPVTVDLGASTHLLRDKVTLGLDVRKARDN